MILSVITLTSIISTTFGQYEANWDSLDSRPLPGWYDEAKVGIFLHWGVYSVPGFGSEWFWKSLQEKEGDYVDFMKANYRPSFTYQEFAKDFTAEFFNPYVWAQIFAKSGAKYVVLTSKHHEGFALWPSKYSYSWNSKDIGAKRDLVGDLAKAVRGENLVFGLYHSMFEWFHPVYNSDKASNYTTQEFVDNKIIPELKELVESYEPAIIWSDGATEAPDTYWKSKEFLAWLYNDSPVKDHVVANDRWGIGVSCNHGDFYTCRDRYNPGVLQEHKWENALTIDKYSWGYRRNAQLSDYMTTAALLTELVTTVSCGGNILINVGPTSDGMIAPIFQERLADLGTWLSINGEAIYASTPWTAQNDSLNSVVWYTSKNEIVYAIALSWPQGNSLELGSVANEFDDSITVTLLGNEAEGPLQWTLNEKSVTISFPDKATVKSEWVYVLKIERQDTNTTNNSL